MHSNNTMLYNIQQLNVWAFKAFLRWWLLDLHTSPMLQVNWAIFQAVGPTPPLLFLKPPPWSHTHICGTSLSKQKTNINTMKFFLVGCTKNLFVVYSRVPSEFWGKPVLVRIRWDWFKNSYPFRLTYQCPDVFLCPFLENMPCTL